MDTKCINRVNNAKALFTTHGMSKTRIYKIWSNMLRRCYSPQSVNYSRYGALGVIVCKEWHDFNCFYKDMNEGYKDDLTLDRIDSSGNYEKTNCKWSTYQEQNENRSSVIHLTIDSETKSVPEWSRLSGISGVIIRQRIAQGMKSKEAVFSPIKILRKTRGQELEFNGKKMTVSKWAKEVNMPMKVLSQRLIKGVSLSKALIYQSK